MKALWNIEVHTNIFLHSSELIIIIIPGYIFLTRYIKIQYVCLLEHELYLDQNNYIFPIKFKISGYLNLLKLEFLYFIASINKP